ncbi:MAG: hypothetical protein SOV80_00265 [Bacilli bacterium]|nr:hypothetical protein [bacterium]MDY2696643.1 hypothetical protein [Bacilli bacterium]MDY2756615.1 hypothetical protein [Candidatus Treponema excrementipullorum]
MSIYFDKKIYTHNIFEVFLFMYVLYPFTIAPIAMIQKMLYYGFIFLCNINFFCNSFSHAYTQKNFSLIGASISCFCICCFNSIVYPVLRNTWDFTFFYTFINFAVRCVCAFSLILLCKNIYDFILLFLKANALYVIFSFFLLIPAVRSAYQDFTGINLPKNLQNQWQVIAGMFYTRFGLQGFSGFEHTFKCSLAIGLGLWLLKFLKFNNTKKTVLFFMLLNFIGCCMYGRVGILSTILIVCCYNSIMIIKYRKTKLFFLLFFIILLSVLVFIACIDIIRDNPITKWAFEPFINLLETGEFSTASSDGLKTMWRLSSLKSAVFGDAKYMENGSYYTGTDVGILRPVLFWGIGGSVFYYLINIFLSITLFKYFKKYNGGILFFMIIGILFFFELKGEINLVLFTILFPMAFLLQRENFSTKSYSKEIVKLLFMCQK